MDFVRALERYVEHQKEIDPEITKRIRPALGCIRFLVLSPADIASTTLLTPLEKIDLIICQSSKGDLSKMPIDFVSNRKDRGTLAGSAQQKKDAKMEIIRALNEIYSSNCCVYCFTRFSQFGHAIWNCNQFHHSEKKHLKDIYQKYNHTCLIDYSEEDLHVIYNSFQILRFSKLFKFADVCKVT